MPIEHQTEASPTTVPAMAGVSTLGAEERRAAMDAIAREVAVCTRCRLHEGRTNAVPGEGHPDTEVVFVGEGPGFNEDQQGRPFVGAAGGFLTELVRSVGWERDQLFITNVVKCRPPGNRDPEPDEIAACAPFLRRQLEVLDPALVVTLGRFSMQTFMPGARIGQAHGTVRAVDPQTGARAARVYAMYHPASAFRQQSLRETIELDMCGIPSALIAAREARAAGGRTGKNAGATKDAPETQGVGMTAGDAPETPSVGMTAGDAPETPSVGMAAGDAQGSWPVAVAIEPDVEPAAVGADAVGPDDQLSLFA